MFNGAAAFLAIALLAAVTGYPRIAGMSVNIAWILFLFGLVFSAVFFVPKQGHAQARAHARGRRMWRRRPD